MVGVPRIWVGESRGILRCARYDCEQQGNGDYDGNDHDNDNGKSNDNNNSKSNDNSLREILRAGTALRITAQDNDDYDSNATTKATAKATAATTAMAKAKREPPLRFGSR